GRNNTDGETASPGWTLEIERFNLVSSSAGSGWIYSIVAGASPPTNFDFTIPAGAASYSVIVHHFRGADSVVAEATDNQSLDAPVDSPAVDAGSSQDLFVFTGMFGATGLPPSSSIPTGYADPYSADNNGAGPDYTNNAGGTQLSVNRTVTAQVEDPPNWSQGASRKNLYTFAVWDSGGGGGGPDPDPDLTDAIQIETFDVDASAGGQTHTLTNDVGDLANAFVRKITATDKATGRVGNTSNNAPRDAHCGIQLTGTDTLTFRKQGTVATKQVGEVWRYSGAAGGPNEFIVRGHLAVTLTGTSASVAVPGLVDRSKAVPFLTGLSTGVTSTSDYEVTTVACHIDSGGNLVVSRGRSGSETITVYVDVVEFTGSNWTIGYARSASHDSSIETCDLRSDSTGAGGSPVDISNWANATIIEASMEGDAGGETGLADVLAFVQPGANTTSITFSVTEGDGNARNDGTGYAYVLGNSEMGVTRTLDTNFAETNGTYGTTSFPAGAPTDRDLDKLALEWFATTSGTGTAHARGRLTGRITDAAGTIQHWVHRSGNNVRLSRGVIDLSALNPGSAGAGSETLTPESAAHGHSAAEPTLQPASSLSPSSSAHAQAAGQAGLSVSVSLAPSDASHGHAADDAAIDAQSSLLPDSAGHVQVVQQASLNAAAALSVIPVSHAHSADQTSLGVAGSLAIEDGDHAHEVISTALAAESVLLPGRTLHSHEADPISLASQSALAPDTSSHEHAAAASTLTVQGSISPSSSQHDHPIGSPELHPASLIAPAGASHAQATAQAALAPASALSPADVDHGHSADVTLLGVAGTLSISPGRHIHLASELVLGASNSIAPEAVASSHTSGVPALQSSSALSSQSVLSNHSADQSSLSVGGSLAPAAISHDQVASAPVLSALASLAVNDTAHSHTLDNASVAPLFNLSPTSVLHGASSSQCALNASSALSPSGLAHVHALAASALVSRSSLAPTDAYSAHFASSPIVKPPDALDPILFFEVQPENRFFNIIAQQREFVVGSDLSIFGVTAEEGFFNVGDELREFTIEKRNSG
ncbi:hypothetical protein, partial [Erythrobacter rubeus]